MKEKQIKNSKWNKKIKSIHVWSCFVVLIVYNNMVQAVFLK